MSGLMDFTWGTDCAKANEWCFTYREPHKHGFACDRTCRCKTEESQWRRRSPFTHSYRHPGVGGGTGCAVMVGDGALCDETEAHETHRPASPVVAPSATDEGGAPLPLHRTEAGYPHCATCDGGGCLDCTDPA